MGRPSSSDPRTGPRRSGEAARNVPYLDATGLRGLEMAIDGLKSRGSRVMMSTFQSKPLAVMMRSGAMRMLGHDHVFKDTSGAESVV